MRKSLIFSLLLSAGVLISSCKKDDPGTNTNTGNNNNNNNNNNTAQLCTGVSDPTYTPLKSGNNWTLKRAGNGKSISMTVNGTETIGGKEYFKMTYDNAGTVSTRYLRTESNGDIMRNEGGQEYFEVPATLTGNQYWSYPVNGGVGKRQVSAESAQVATAACSYTGCAIINEFDSGGTKVAAYSFKKGIGLVRIYDFESVELVGVTLK